MWPSSRTFTIPASKYTMAYSSSSGRACQALTSSITASVTLEISVGDTSMPYISSRWPWISRVVIPRRVHRNDLVVKACPARLALGHDLGIKARLAVARSFHLQLTDLPLQGFLAFPVTRVPPPVAR